MAAKLPQHDPLPLMGQNERNALRDLADAAYEQQNAVEGTTKDQFDFAFAVGVETVLRYLAGDAAASDDLVRCTGNHIGG